MSSIYSADNCYYPLGPAVGIQYGYTKGSVMHYIYNKCPLFALFLQRIGKDREFDSPGFNSTCFVPSEDYSNEYIDYFEKSGYYFAERVIYNSTISNRVEKQDLTLEEFVPNYAGDFISVKNCDGNVFANGVKVLFSVECNNGVVNVLEGLIGLKRYGEELL